jgi:hypothetical protein
MEEAREQRTEERGRRKKKDVRVSRKRYVERFTKESE